MSGLKFSVIGSNNLKEADQAMATIVSDNLDRAARGFPVRRSEPHTFRIVIEKVRQLAEAGDQNIKVFFTPPFTD